MAEQVQKTKAKAGMVEVDIDDLPEAVETPEIDDLLAEIDEVLEENAQEFVEGFVQRGGQ